MRIDPKGTVRGYPTMLIRQTLRRLRGGCEWGVETLENAAKLPPGAGRAFAKALQAEGLIEVSRHGGWTVTQAGDTMAVATAARPVTRQTAERALAEFLEQVARVNDDPYFLARVVRVALYGSMLRPEVERLSDVDLAVQLVAKEADFERLREANAERVEQLAILGQRFSNFLEEQFCWLLEAFRFLKGRSRVISLADYTVEKRLVLAVPHRMLLGEPDELEPEPPPKALPTPRKRRPRDCPFRAARKRQKYDKPNISGAMRAAAKSRAKTLAEVAICRASGSATSARASESSSRPLLGQHDTA